MLMANCLINRFGLFYCHSLRSSSCCKMADWSVCLFTDIPLRLVSSALSSPLSSDVSVSLSAQNMVISESCVLLYAYADIMHNIFVLICLYVGWLWGHGFIWATQRHHIPVLSFTLIQFDFLTPLADLFICAYRNALHRQSSESGCMCGDGLCCDSAIFFFLFETDVCDLSCPEFICLLQRAQEVKSSSPFDSITHMLVHIRAHLHVAHLLYCCFPAVRSEPLLMDDWAKSAF